MIYAVVGCLSGLLELDLVMGQWAAQNVPKLDAKGLDEVSFMRAVLFVLCYVARC